MPMIPPAGRTALAALALLAGCSNARPDDVVCTLEYRTITVHVVDADGAPVAGLTPVVRNLRTGETLSFGEENPFGGEGTYLVATDAHAAQLSASGDTLRFRAEGAGRAAEAAFVVAGGPCHVEKRSGPERIVAQPE